jgi:hypothetical protein
VAATVALAAHAFVLAVAAESKSFVHSRILVNFL